MRARDPVRLIEACRWRGAVSMKAGPWTLRTQPITNPYDAAFLGMMLGEPYTMLTRPARSSLAPYEEGVCEHPDVVMEDSRRELRRHLPILLAARGQVLITGLGMGCVLRGLLSLPEVESVDVVEIDGAILDLVAEEFARDPRVRIHHGDALTLKWCPDARWDYAWHDIWCEGPGLNGLHLQLLERFCNRCPRQGAWTLPREAKRLLRRRLSWEVIG